MPSIDNGCPIHSALMSPLAKPEILQAALGTYEILQNIMSHGELEAIWTYRRVARSWRTVASDPVTLIRIIAANSLSPIKASELVSVDVHEERHLTEVAANHAGYDPFTPFHLQTMPWTLHQQLELMLQGGAVFTDAGTQMFHHRFLEEIPHYQTEYVATQPGLAWTNSYARSWSGSMAHGFSDGRGKMTKVTLPSTDQSWDVGILARRHITVPAITTMRMILLNKPGVNEYVHSECFIYVATGVTFGDLVAVQRGMLASAEKYGTDAATLQTVQRDQLELDCQVSFVCNVELSRLKNAATLIQGVPLNGWL